MTTFILIFLNLQAALAFYLILSQEKRLKLQAQQQQIFTQQQVDACREFFAEDMKNTIGVTHTIATRVATFKAKVATKETLEALLEDKGGAFQTWLRRNSAEMKKIMDGGGK